MVDVRISGDILTLEFLGWSKLWAFRNRLDIPLASLRSVHVGEPIPTGFYFRVLGTGFPRAISAGMFTDFKRWAFFDLRRDRSNVIVLELQRWKYAVVAVEVTGDASALAASLRTKIDTRAESGAIS